VGGYTSGRKLRGSFDHSGNSHASQISNDNVTKGLRNLIKLPNLGWYNTAKIPYEYENLFSL